MGRIFFLLFAAVPLIEIATFIVIGQAIGLWPTLLGVLVMALLGSVIIRVQGLSLLRDIRETMGRGQLPARQLADAMLVGVAGLMLLLPGYFSDLIGLLLLIPQVRGLLYAYLSRNMVVMTSATASAARPPQRLDGVVDLDESDWREG